MAVELYDHSQDDGSSMDGAGDGSDQVTARAHVPLRATAAPRPRRLRASRRAAEGIEGAHAQVNVASLPANSAVVKAHAQMIRDGETRWLDPRFSSGGRGYHDHGFKTTS